MKLKLATNVILFCNYIMSVRYKIPSINVVVNPSLVPCRKAINSKFDEVTEWLGANPEGEEDEYEERLKEVEGFYNPFLTKLYQDVGGSGGVGSDVMVEMKIPLSATGTDIVSLKHASSIFRQSSNPVSGFSMMEQVRPCAVLLTENWLFHESLTG